MIGALAMSARIGLRAQRPSGYNSYMKKATIAAPMKSEAWPVTIDKANNGLRRKTRPLRPYAAAAEAATSRTRSGVSIG